MGWSKFKEQSFNSYSNMFVDREDFISLIEDEYSEFSRNTDYFKVISLFGIGGIGKSSLIEKVKKIIDEKKDESHLVIINMDIMHSAEVLDNLIKVRKQLKKGCMYFDFALLMIWDDYSHGALNDDFMHFIKESYMNVFSAINVSIGVITKSQFGVSISLENVFSLVRQYMPQICKHYMLNEDIITNIKSRYKKSPEKLYEYMPFLLGTDLNKIAGKQRLIALFDTYRPYVIDHDDWLKELIGASGLGLYIIASRDKLQWNVPSENFIPYSLKELPDSYAELMLKSQLAGAHYKYIPDILDKTKRVPIYLDLAVSLYKKLQGNTPDMIDREFGFIREQKDFIKCFLEHLPMEDQKLVLTLSIIGIFDKTIFEWIVKDLNLKCDIFKFNTFCQNTLFNYLREDQNFLKLHDIFITNARLFIPMENKTRIFQSYIKYIAIRGVFYFQSNQMAILFRNILGISECVDIEINEVEYICDIFFYLFENNRLPELYDLVKENRTANLTIFRVMVDALYFEKHDAAQSYDRCVEFAHNSHMLGRHKLSYDLIQNYSRAIKGDYEESRKINESLYNSLNANDKAYWYYGKTKIYFADQLMLSGHFKSALQIFQEYLEELEALSYKNGDIFEVKKQMGHCKRWNFLLKEADDLYSLIKSTYTYSKQMQLYALTCLCETKCYIDPKAVEELSQEGLSLCELLNRPKDEAKIYYSLAIAALHNANYPKSEQYIEKSLELNRVAHYPAGELFAYVARLYLEYSQYGYIEPQTVTLIRQIYSEKKVYRFLELPICILNKDSKKMRKIKTEFDWINFDMTVKEYQKFFASIKKI